MQDGALYDTEAGTPQGGIISPLLANISLHGMENALGVKYNNRGEITGRRAVVRYADDFLVFCETKEDAEESVKTLNAFLSNRGLTLSSEKTKIVHLKEGIDFLGFNIRQYTTINSKTGWKLLIKPSKEAKKKIREKIKTKWLKLKSSEVKIITETLNPIIRGWCNYYRIGVSSEAFSSLDNWMFHREQRYAKRMHPNKRDGWRKKRYWGRLNLNREDNWVFGDKRTGRYLLKFSWFEIERHTLIKGRSSPDDPNLKEYWAGRNKEKSKDHIPSYQKIAKRQEYVCPVCGESLFNDEELHLHHVVPLHQGGSDKYSNLQLMHLYCHQQVHSEYNRVTDLVA